MHGLIPKLLRRDRRAPELGIKLVRSCVGKTDPCIAHAPQRHNGGEVRECGLEPSLGAGETAKTGQGLPPGGPGLDFLRSDWITEHVAAPMRVDWIVWDVA